MPAPAARIDRALGRHAGAWLRHPVLGDPSFDAFGRHPGNPIHRGRPPLEWPVNGFLFHDPAGGGWFAYVGHYERGYAMGPGRRMECTVYASADDGASWMHEGPVFPAEPFVFDGSTAPADYAPDVSVVCEDGRYHMAFDWVSADAEGLRGGTSGVGYAVADTPTGPFRRHPVPLVDNRDSCRQPLLGKFDRLYATTLVRRADDWLLLTLADSGPFHAWALVGRSAPAPQGPYGEPVVLLHTEDHRFLPPLMEYFPAFVHEGWVYAPSTSVARNRNFQLLHRARLESALSPAAWELLRHGSLWHAEPVEHEAAGIWGQTFSGCVDDDGDLRVLFPSRDAAGRGTINLARRPWHTPLRERGFHLSGHGGPSLTCLAGMHEDVEVRAVLRRGGTAALLWGMAGPLGADTVRADARPHRLCRSDLLAFELTPRRWRLLALDAAGTEVAVAEGDLPGGAVAAPDAGPERPTPLDVGLRHRADGTLQLRWEDEVLWEGTRPVRRGRVGLWVDADSWAEVDAFEVSGDGVAAVGEAAAGKAGWLPWLYTDALLGAGQSMADWEEVADPAFRYGIGARCRGDGGRAKWSFHGAGFRLWAPGGPDGGSVDVWLDGAPVGRLDLRDAAAVSAPRLWRTDLPAGAHTVVLRAASGSLTVDSLDVWWPAAPPTHS